MENKNLRIERKQKNQSTSRGMRTDITGGSIKNFALLSVPEDEFALLKPHLEPVEIPTRRILHEAGERIHFAYFLNDGLASLVVLTKDGRSVEIAIVGREGVVGTPLGVNLHRGPYRVIMQIPGRVLRIKSAALEDILPKTPQFGLILNRYVLIQGLEVAQIAACNRLHEIEQRLARWLLMCQDRVDSALLPITHEFLSQMLGTGRPSISLASGMLQRAGVIENLRGTVKITNRNALEDASCECYQAMQNFNDDNFWHSHPRK